MNDLTKGNISKQIIDLTIPGYYGMLGISIFNVVDTYFVSLLGTTELSAISFTFSIVMIVNLIIIGLGIGIASLISRAVGEADDDKKVHIIMTGLLFSAFCAVLITIIGLLTIDPVFTLLGANETTMPYIKSYMIPWYTGCIFLFSTMIGGQIFRGLGDTKTPGRLMVLSAVINIVLDPLLIFTFDMGVSGAAIATVLSRVFTSVIYLYILSSKYNVISFTTLKLSKMITNLKQIMIIGVPNSLAKVVSPLIITFVTMILATTSQEAVAGYGVGTKIESFILAIAFAFSNTATAMIGQNYGSKNITRVNEIMKYINKYSMYVFAVLYVILFISAPYISAIFLDDENTIRISNLYLRIVPLSYGLQSIYFTASSFLNIIQRPFIPTIIGFAQFIFIIIPLSYIFAPTYGVEAVFISITIGFIVCGLVSLKLENYMINKLLN